MGYGKLKTITTDHTVIPMPKCKEHIWNIFQHYSKDGSELEWLERICGCCYQHETCKITWKRVQEVTYIFGDGTIKKWKQKRQKK